MNEFADEAERMRKAGDPQAAVEMVEAGLAVEPDNDRGRIVLALALLDLGDLARARERLERAFPAETPVVPVAFPPEAIGLAGELSDDELESAFAEAETNPDEMMSANKVVEQTLENEHVDVPEAGFDITESPTYATETMASILEEQGRVDDARSLRDALIHPDAELGPTHVERVSVLATLESWLHNLRQNAERDPRDSARTARGPQSS